MQNTINQRLTEYCGKRGIKQVDLVVAGYASKQTISWIWNGRTKPGCEFLERFIAKYTEINARWLLTGEGEMEDQSSNAVIEYLEKKVTEKENLILDLNKEINALKEELKAVKK